MTKAEFNTIAKQFSHEIAQKCKELEQSIDNYFLKEKKYKVTDYRKMKKIVMKVISQKIPDIIVQFHLECRKEMNLNKKKYDRHSLPKKK